MINFLKKKLRQVEYYIEFFELKKDPNYSDTIQQYKKQKDQLIKELESFGVYERAV